MELQSFRRLAHSRFGIVLPDNAESFLQSRLRTLMDRTGHRDLEALLQAAEAESNGDLFIDIVEQLSTNHSYFYREPAHFEFLSSVALPEITERLRRQRSRDLRIWSAAAAAGEEAYSIAMAMRTFYGAHYQDMDAGVLATDIAKRSLQRGAEGVYRSETFRHIPQAWRDSFLEPAGEDSFRVIRAVRDDVMFRWLNLVGSMSALRGGFHVIFCRNVMIYFDAPTRERLVQSLTHLLAPGGYLFIGHTDDAEFARKYLDQQRPAIFRKRAGS
ncbi:CheR family methyltransferase [Thalassobaculum salexigens]|uniref:CheR family methyltransferase n=1 Tax=Thalassobaculum salexigens TaxID=455360 RepID=UPI00248F17C3|nr:protein-glutamate O-methyltransferase CheR [Thalassobaculum salexigens]